MHVPVISNPVLVSPGEGVATQEGGGAVSTGGGLVVQEKVGLVPRGRDFPGRDIPIRMSMSCGYAYSAGQKREKCDH